MSKYYDMLSVTAELTTRRDGNFWYMVTNEDGITALAPRWYIENPDSDEARMRSDWFKHWLDYT